MKTRLTPHYISLVYEACLKSFWRRKALARFLRQCLVTEEFLQSWAPDESKREVLDRFFLSFRERPRAGSLGEDGRFSDGARVLS